jgi:hypothetical protein
MTERSRIEAALWTAAVSILDLFVIHRGTPRQVVIVFLVRCAMA